MTDTRRTSATNPERTAAVAVGTAPGDGTTILLHHDTGQ